MRSSRSGASIEPSQAALISEDPVTLAGDLLMSKTKTRTKPSDYFPDIDEWPNEWMGVDEDLEIGRGLMRFFTPFLQLLIDEGYAKKTIDTHGSNLNILGGDII